MELCVGGMSSPWFLLFFKVEEKVSRVQRGVVREVGMMSGEVCVKEENDKVEERVWLHSMGKLGSTNKIIAHSS
ncbi:hypothetical protein DD606_24870 [Enterobacter cloacae complex sp. GF14B]|nr:hypothetical protein DD606_24870 [Enterobacter cloacae complex sp. GF14B]